MLRSRNLSLGLAAAAADGPHAAVIQPPALRAPEVILGCEWGPSADIWNLGCLASRLPIVLFDPFLMLSHIFFPIILRSLNS